MRRIAGAALLALVVASCGGDGTETSSTAGDTTTSFGVQTTDAATTTAVPTTTTTPTTTAAPVPGIGAQLLVAGADGVFLVDTDGTISLLIDSAAIFAVDDLNGGVLFQIERWSRGGRSVVYRVRPDGTDAVKTLVPTSEQGLTLNGVAVDGDETFAYYSRNEGSTIEDSKETLRRFSLDTREVTELSTIGGWESGAFPISVSQSLILYNWGAEALHGMYLTDLQANDAAVAANPTPDEGYEDCWVCPSLGELSHDGTRLVYLEFDQGYQAVIRHVASGAEIRRIKFPFAGDDSRVVSFDLSATHLVVNLVNANADDNEPAVAWVYDLSKVDPEPNILSVSGTAYLTLSPVTVRNLIPAP